MQVTMAADGGMAETWVVGLFGEPRYHATPFGCTSQYDDTLFGHTSQYVSTPFGNVSYIYHSKRPYGGASRPRTARYRC
jgi:hypothetical protein